MVTGISSVVKLDSNVAGLSAAGAVRSPVEFGHLEHSQGRLSSLPLHKPKSI